MITPEICEAASRLEIRLKSRLNSLLEGSYRTSFHGSGMQFKDFRPYEPGDDIRHMSWSVTARTGKPTIKLYETERELDVIALVDTSGSSLFGSAGKRKIDMYAEVVALLGLCSIGAGDNFGAMLFNDTITHFIKPSRNRDQVPLTLTHILASEPQGKKADLSYAIQFAAQSLKHRSLIIILSDFWVPPFESTLGTAAKRHECILLHGYDDREAGTGISGMGEYRDPETDEIYLVDGNSQETRHTLSSIHFSHQVFLEKTAAKVRCDFLGLSTHDDYVQRLVLFFERRGPTRL